ncbi:TNF receptor-associated factor 6 [Rhipicephalus sanguineus]|uniref:TNF receptor-associated factor 6 n=1 Tax=Rhipicephalus sanguineus TaxID=34632 RepID=UPI0020C21A3B|nr:TNF receptor-associated factor 6 [Rhipicephalus sanguineus]
MAASSSSRSATRRAEMPTDLAVYSVENFEPRPPQELVCTVCRGVYREPVECPCRHVFCSICIHGWLAYSASPGSGSCPLCRREMTVSQVVPVVPLVNNMIAHLTVRCPNREAGCIAKMTLESVNHHLETCEFNRALCPDCGAQMRASELSSHQLEQCSKRLVRCTRGCCFSLLAERQRDHNCIYEMRNYISSLEQTRDMLRHQLDHTLQCLSRLQRQIRELAVRVEACAVRVRELGAAPSAQRAHMRTEGPPKIPVPDPVAPSWDLSTDPDASLSGLNQEELSTSTRLSVPTVSEMLAASTPLAATSSAALNETTGGTHGSPSVVDLATERTPELHFDQQSPAPMPMKTGIRLLLPERNVDDTDMEYGQLGDGGGYLSSMMRRLWVSGRHRDGSSSPPAE